MRVGVRDGGGSSSREMELNFPQGPIYTAGLAYGKVLPDLEKREEKAVEYSDLIQIM